MKKALLLGAPGLIVVILIGVILVYPATNKPGWQPILEAYLAYTDSSARLLSFHRASRPAGFDSSPSKTTFSPSPVFHTSLPAGTVGDLNLDALAYQGNGLESALAPLPYPPAELWCLQLSEPDGMVFAALHIDLYNADWVIHLIDETRLSAIQVAVGCYPE